MRIAATNKGRFAIYCSMMELGAVRRIPGVRFNSKGRMWVAAPTRLARQYIIECIVPYAESVSPEARAMLDAPAVKRVPRPVPVDYHTKTEPFTHQRAATAFAASMDVGALFMEMGTGKTKSIIDALAIHYGAERLSAVLVICPLTVLRVWEEQLSIHCPVEYSVVLNHKLSDKEYKLFSAAGVGLRFMVVGVQSIIHSAGKFAEKFLLEHPNSAVVVDESHTIKNFDAMRTKRVIELGQMARFRYILTGTPIANNIQDLYSQFQFLDEDIIGSGSFWNFRDRYCVMGGYEGRQVVGYQNTGELMDTIKPLVHRVTKEECLDLPPKVYQQRYVELPPSSRTIYNKMKAEWSAQSITVKSTIEEMLRLHQVVAGFMGTGDERVVLPARSPKLAELEEIIEESAGSMVIWCAHRYELQQVVEMLSAEFGSTQVVQVHGGVTREARAAAVDALQSGRARFLVGTVAAGGTGITATRAKTMVFMSNTFNYVDRIQGEDRVHRIGQTESVTIIDIICADTVEEDVWEALQEKSSVAEWVGNKLNKGE
jgi:SNF2 family DNA or RNA helicase